MLSEKPVSLPLGSCGGHLQEACLWDCSGKKSEECWAAVQRLRAVWGSKVGRPGAVLAPRLPSCMTLSRLLHTLSEPRFPCLQSAHISDTTPQGVRIGRDKSGKTDEGLASYQELSLCCLLSVREVMVFVKKCLSVF